MYFLNTEIMFHQENVEKQQQTNKYKKFKSKLLFFQDFPQINLELKEILFKVTIGNMKAKKESFKSSASPELKLKLTHITYEIFDTPVKLLVLYTWTIVCFTQKNSFFKFEN